MSLHLPPSWDRMSDHSRACYLVDSHQARDYAKARRAVGREKLRRKHNLIPSPAVARLPYADN